MTDTRTSKDQLSEQQIRNLLADAQFGIKGGRALDSLLVSAWALEQLCEAALAQRAAHEPCAMLTPQEQHAIHNVLNFCKLNPSMASTIDVTARTLLKGLLDRASKPPGDAEIKDWKFVAQTLEECQNRLQSKDGGARHSWMDPALDIARGRAGSVPTKGADTP